MKNRELQEYKKKEIEKNKKRKREFILKKRKCNVEKNKKRILKIIKKKKRDFVEKIKNFSLVYKNNEINKFSQFPKQVNFIGKSKKTKI